MAQHSAPTVVRTEAARPTPRTPSAFRATAVLVDSLSKFARGRRARPAAVWPATGAAGAAAAARPRSRQDESEAEEPPLGVRPVLRRCEVPRSGKDSPTRGVRRRLAAKVAHRLIYEEVFEKLPIFRGRCAEFIQRLADESQERHLRANEEVVCEGTVGDSLLVVLSGRLRMSVDGSEVGVLREGQCIGEALLLGVSEHWDVTLTALGNAMVCTLPQAAFHGAQEESPVDGHAFEALRRAHCSADYLRAGIAERPVELLRGSSAHVTRLLDQCAVRRLFFPGEALLREGEPSAAMHIVVKGDVRVELLGKLLREEQGGGRGAASSAPLAFGDLCLLGLRETPAVTVVAATVCQSRVIYRPTLQRVLDVYSEATPLTGFVQEFLQKQVSKATDSVSLGPLRALGLFNEADCSKAFLQFLNANLESRLYIKGQTLVAEASEDTSCLFFIRLGSVEVLRGGAPQAVLQSGASFGELSVLGMAAKRTSSVVALEVCHTEVLHQRILMRGFELFPEERRKIMYPVLRRFAEGADGLEDKAMLSQLLGQSSFFGAASAAFLESLSRIAGDRIYVPGEVVIRAGQQATSMFIVLSGQAGVFQVEEASPTPDGFAGGLGAAHASAKLLRIGILQKGAVIGEMAMLGLVKTSSATVEAESLCCMYEIDKSAVPIIFQFPEVCRKVVESLKLRLEHTVKPRFANLPLFQEFSDKFKSFLAVHAERQVFFPEHEVARDGDVSQHVYVVNVGTVALNRRGITTKRYQAGSHFGAALMVGFRSQQPGTYVTLTTCHLLTFSRNTYAHALKEAGEGSAVSHRLAREELAEHEETTAAVLSVGAKRRILERYAKILMDSAQDVKSGKVFAILEYFVAWARCAVKSRVEHCNLQWTQRQESHSIEHWLQSRREACERARQRRAQELVPEAGGPAWRGRPRGPPPPAASPAASPAAAPPRPPEGPAPPALPLLQVTFQSVAGAGEASAVATLRQLRDSWPSPKPSKFYNLTLWNVLSDTLGASATGAGAGAGGRRPRGATSASPPPSVWLPLLSGEAPPKEKPQTR